MSRALVTPASKLPVASYGRWIVLTAALVAVWGAPALAAKMWSTTDWRPSAQLSTIIEAYSNLMHPEQVAGSGLSGALFGVTVIGLLVAVFASILATTTYLNGRRGARSRGLAHGAELAPFSARAMVRRSEVILGERDRDPARSGLCLGREKYSRRDVWIPKESTLLVLAPPRSGKTSGTVAPAVVAHDGPVVATGVRDDIMAWTHPWRRHAGPMWLCEPMREPSRPLPGGVRPVRWSPLRGCDDVVTARLRAEALFAAVPEGGANDTFWRNNGQMLLSTYLLAAALGDGRMSDIVAWADRDTDSSPVDVIRSFAQDLEAGHVQAALMSSAAQLEAAIAQDPRYKAGVTGQVLQTIEPFRIPRIAEMCDVSIADSFDPDDFVASSGTIWMLGSDSQQRQAAGVCTALTAAIAEAARDAARRSAHGRLRPPLLLALDEAVNVAPIPRLDQLLSTGGGSGLQTIVVLQSMAAARNAWGKEMGDALLDFNNAKLILGGLSDANDLDDLSRLLGQREELTAQSSRNARMGLLDPGDSSWSWRQVPVMRPDEIRALNSEERGEALLIARNARGIMLRQPRIFSMKQPPPPSRAER
jgi:type IV secretory pathway TraG/TraD family ATPase VirD4